MCIENILARNSVDMTRLSCLNGNVADDADGPVIVVQVHECSSVAQQFQPDATNVDWTIVFPIVLLESPAEFSVGLTHGEASQFEWNEGKHVFDVGRG